MSKASNYQEWRQLAYELDKLLKNVEWRAQPKSKQYDHKLISARLNHLRALEVQNDVPSQMFFVRAGHLRNLGGIGSVELYRHSYLGTKFLIEEYVQEVINRLYFISESDQLNALNGFNKVEFFSELLQTFGRTVLILHGGASFGLCHLGVVKALHERHLLPGIICGSYIGALVASLICTQSPDRLSEILSGDGINFEAFYQHGTTGSFRRKLTRFLKHGRLLDIRVLQTCARENIGDITFKEAYLKSGLILNITVQAKRKNEVPVLLNYLTAPDLIIWTAACASLATPGIYEEVVLLCKREDGSICQWNPSAVKLETARIVGELPIKRLTEMFNANNFIVSQVPSYLTWSPMKLEKYRSSLMGNFTSIITKELWHRFNQLKELGLIPDFALDMVSFLKAPMMGDIQISPTIYCTDIQYIFTNPTSSFVQYCIHKGEVATWRKYGHVQARCAIEFAIADILKRL